MFWAGGGLNKCRDELTKLMGSEASTSAIVPATRGNGQLDHHHLSAKGVSLLLDVIADLPEGIAVTPVFAADKHKALKIGKELFPNWVSSSVL